MINLIKSAGVALLPMKAESACMYSIMEICPAASLSVGFPTLFQEHFSSGRELFTKDGILSRFLFWTVAALKKLL